MTETIAYMAHPEEEETPDPFLEEEKQKLLALFPGIVFQDEKSATITPLVHCKLYPKHNRPIRDGVRNLGFHKREWLRNEIDELLKAGIIRPSRSPHAAAPVIVQKKDGTYHLVIDYRRVNEATEDFLYFLPNIPKIFDCFAGVKWFTTLDLARGYWQIAMDPDSLPYTSFITPFGQYEFLVMPFGLKQAPGWFQLLMNDVLRPVIAKTAVVYLDDIIIFSKGILQDHIRDVEKVFLLIQQATLQIKIKKCKFFQKEIKFLGHKISQEGISTDLEKIEAMQNLPTPKNLRDVQSVLGLFQYYKNFVKNFARIAAPIYLALKKDQFQWGPEQDRTFNYLKKAMTETPILAHLNYDKEFILYTDASYLGLGFILAQKDDQEKEHPVC